MIRALHLFMGPTQVEPGCLSCCVYQNADKSTVILYMEHWSSWETLAMHIQTTRYVQLLELMEASLETPLLSFHNMQEARGMEYLKSVRGGLPISSIDLIKSEEK